MATAGVELELARPASTGWPGRIAGQLWATLPEGRALPEAAWRDRHRAVLVLLWLHALGLATFGVALGYGLAHSVAEGAVIAAAAMLAAQPRLGRRWRSAVASLGLITASAVLVHLSGGYVEAHFHFFVMIVVIGLYQDWVPFLIALGYVVLHHGVLGALVPDSVYNHPDALAYPWKWAAIHAAFVLATSAATVAGWRLSEAARARTEASEARLRLLTERMPAVLWSTDAALQFVAAQGAGLAALNVRGEQLVGTSLEERFGDQRSGGGGPEGPTMSAHRRALQGESVSFELLWAGRTFEARVEPLRRPDGATTGTVAVAVDVTERLAAESERQRLVTTSQAKSAFLANMSHEIRTPMNAIMGMADLLAETPLSPEQREYVGIFQRAGDSLLALINDILDLSKVEADQLELEQTAFDPAALLEDVAEVLAAPAHAKGLELFCEVSADVPARVVGDPQRLRQVLLNLLGNAVKFTARGEVGLRLDVLPAVSSSLVLPAGTPGDAVNRVALRFAVRDTGIGIPRATLPGVFDPFTQADASTTRRYGGTGLGLAIVKRLVELMGGRIEVESVLERGSVFTITIPLAVTRVVPGAPPAPVVNLSGARVLVVDDHATNRLLLRRLLATQGAAVEEADGGAAALVALHGARIAGAPYDLVLLDRWMPDLDGFEVVTRARAAGEDGAAAARTILLLTSDKQVGDAARARALGIGGYLVKPIKHAALLAAVTALRRPGGSGTTVDDPPLPTPLAVPPAGGLRLLLADDSADNRRLVQFYFSKLPYVLDLAEDGAAAVVTFQSGVYDLVLMDVHMPVLDGYAATRAIRAWEREQGRPPTPILALTASAMAEDVQQALDAGCDAHVAKPVKKQTLVEAVEQYARQGP